MPVYGAFFFFFFASFQKAFNALLLLTTFINTELGKFALYNQTVSLCCWLGKQPCWHLPWFTHWRRLTTSESKTGKSNGYLLLSLLQVVIMYRNQKKTKEIERKTLFLPRISKTELGFDFKCQSYSLPKIWCRQRHLWLDSKGNTPVRIPTLPKSVNDDLAFGLRKSYAFLGSFQQVVKPWQSQRTVSHRTALLGSTFFYNKGW